MLTSLAVRVLQLFPPTPSSKGRAAAAPKTPERCHCPRNCAFPALVGAKVEREGKEKAKWARGREMGGGKERRDEFPSSPGFPGLRGRGGFGVWCFPCKSCSALGLHCRGQGTRERTRDKGKDKGRDKGQDKG